MSNEQFDPNLFLDQTTEVAAERRPPLPPGDYMGIIREGIEVKPWVSGKDATKSGNALYLKIDVEVTPDLQFAMGLEKSTLTLSDSCFIDVTADGRSLDWSKGKNGDLRRYREALGMNTPGVRFSPRMMVGRPLRVKIKHEDYQGSPVERINGVAGI